MLSLTEADIYHGRVQSLAEEQGSRIEVLIEGGN